MKRTLVHRMSWTRTLSIACAPQLAQIFHCSLRACLQVVEDVPWVSIWGWQIHLASRSVWKSASVNTEDWRAVPGSALWGQAGVTRVLRCSWRVCIWPSFLAHWDLMARGDFFSGSTQSVFHMKHLLGFSCSAGGRVTFSGNHLNI